MDSTLQRGFRWGVVGTIVMSVLMLATVVTGVSPLPEPIPKALVTSVLGVTTPPLVVLLAVGGHLLYGGAFGGLLASALDRRPSLAPEWRLLAGAALGLALWLGLLVVVFPVLGWGVAGRSLGPRAALATLVLHLVYGLVVGAGLRSRTAVPETATVGA